MGALTGLKVGEPRVATLNIEALEMEAEREWSSWRALSGSSNGGALMVGLVLVAEYSGGCGCC